MFSQFDDISEILPGKLYLSSLGPVNRGTSLLSAKITHVLSVTHSFVERQDDIKYMSIQLFDNEHANIAAHFELGTKFIQDALEHNEGRVLVHCDAGVSRSSTMVIAFLIKNQGMNLTQAHTLVKKQRSIIAPNLGFLLQLYRFSRTLQIPNHDDISVIVEEICQLGFEEEKVEQILRKHDFDLDPTMEELDAGDPILTDDD